MKMDNTNIIILVLVILVAAAILYFIFRKEGFTPDSLGWKMSESLFSNNSQVKLPVSRPYSEPIVSNRLDKLPQQMLPIQPTYNPPVELGWKRGMPYDQMLDSTKDGPYQENSWAAGSGPSGMHSNAFKTSSGLYDDLSIGVL